MKVELKMQYLDEWMLRWRKFQTESDWQIEKNRQWWRQTNLLVGGSIMSSLVIYTAGTATVKRWFGAPHFFDVGADAKLKEALCTTITSRPRFTPQGYMRFFVVAAPTYAAFFGLEHMAERRRLRQYLKQSTVFGEQARRLVETGKIEEYLPVNIQASLPQSQKLVYA